MATGKEHKLTEPRDIHEALVREWGSWGPTLAPDGRRMAFISDRGGLPQLWLQTIGPPGRSSQPAEVLPLADDPVCSVAWSADGNWLAYTVAAGGGVRTQVWVVRPDGTDARRVGGHDDEHAVLGPWTRHGRRVVVTTMSTRPGEGHRCYLIEPSTGEREMLAEGYLVDTLDISEDERFALLCDGPRGARYCVTLDRQLDSDHPLLSHPATGSTDAGVLRPSPPAAHGGHATGQVRLTAYLVSDAGLPRPALLAVPIGPDGRRGEAGRLAAHSDAELESIDADDAGRSLVLVWNEAGRSIVELYDTTSGRRRVVTDLPEAVVSDCSMARNGRSVVMCLESPASSKQIWRLDTTTLAFSRLSDQPPGLTLTAVSPTLESFEAHDGLPLTGWLYRPPNETGAGPVVLSLHGGPEAQERPVFNPYHQALVAAGISVFAPNVRGSTGFGRAFAHADDRYGRYDAIEDVAACVRHLVAEGVADPSRLALVGRSYGGYLTLASMVHHPDLFVAGVDICGMSDLLTFFRDTEPWIAAASVSKYGDPEHDRALLHDLSPLHHSDRIDAPLLVVHGEHDTNVPLNEATQIVSALRRTGSPVEYLELAGEGHEYRRQSSKLLLLEYLTRFLCRHLLPSHRALRTEAS